MKKKTPRFMTRMNWISLAMYCIRFRIRSLYHTYNANEKVSGRIASVLTAITQLYHRWFVVVIKQNYLRPLFITFTGAIQAGLPRCG